MLQQLEEQPQLSVTPGPFSTSASAHVQTEFIGEGDLITGRGVSHDPKFNEPEKIPEKTTESKIYGD
jgi:hypothetical protein